MAQSKLELLLELKNHLSTGFTKANAYVNAQMSGLSAKVSQFSAANTKAFSAIQDEVPGAARAIGLLTNPYVLAAAAAVAFAAASTKAVGMALDWESGMAKVNVTAQLSRDGLDGLSKKLLWIGANGTTPLEEIPSAFNTIISAVGDVDKALAILGPTLKATKAGFTDVKTVADAATGVMASSGESVKVVFDTLFATLNKGKAEFHDVAQYLPEVIPGARNAGFALYETAGAFALLTVRMNGMKSATGLKNVFKSLADPDITKNFEAMGISIFDLTGKARPFLNIVQDLSKKMNGLTDQARQSKFKSLGLDMEAAGAFALMIQNVEELKTDIDFVKNSAGQLDEAFKNAKVSTVGWAGAWNKVMFLAIEFGQLFLPMIDTMGNGFNVILGTFTNGILAMKMIFSGIGTAWDELMRGMTAGVGAISEAIVNLFDPLKLAQSLMKVRDTFIGIDIGGAFAKGAKSGYSDYVASQSASSLMPGAVGGTDSTAMAGGGSTGGASSIGGATPNKSITINLEALQKGNTFNLKMPGDTGDGMSLDAFEKNLNEIFLRLLRNTSQAY